MDIFCKHFDSASVAKVFDRFSHIPFSFFQDCVPTIDQLNINPINIFSHQEPDNYEGTQSWVLKNKTLFSAILTWDDKLLNNCEQAVFVPFGHTWLTEDQIAKTRQKVFEIAHLSGALNLTYGHAMRHEILDRQNEIKIPKRFYRTIGSRYDIADARVGKEHVFGEPQFAVVVENTSHNGYFTEKILDCFLMKTVPLYWGCSNLENFFDTNSVIRFDNPDHLISIANGLSPDSYSKYADGIERNYRLAGQYIDYLGNIANRLDQLFINNNLCNWSVGFYENTK